MTFRHVFDAVFRLQGPSVALRDPTIRRPCVEMFIRGITGDRCSALQIWGSNASRIIATTTSSINTSQCATLEALDDGNGSSTRSGQVSALDSGLQVMSIRKEEKGAFWQGSGDKRSTTPSLYVFGLLPFLGCQLLLGANTLVASESLNTWYAE